MAGSRVFVLRFQAHISGFRISWLEREHVMSGSERRREK
jgi:hypothetical protein